MSSSSCYLVDTNIFHNSHTTLSQNLKLLAFLWRPYLDLGSSKPPGYFYGCSSSAASSCRYFCYRHSYKSQSELLRRLVFWSFLIYLAACLLVMCLVFSLHQELLNPISTKSGKSTEIAKTLSSCKFCANGWFNRGERWCICTLPERKARLPPALTYQVWQQTQPGCSRHLVESPQEVGGKQEGNWKYCD